MRFETFLGRQLQGEITQVAGADGLPDRRLNRPSPRCAPHEALERMHGLFRYKYSDFTVKHFYEQKAGRRRRRRN
jgi:hypothetical protein